MKTTEANLILNNWWKILLIVCATIVSRQLMLQLIPLSPTFDISPSAISKTFGMIPTAATVVTILYLVIAIIMMLIQKDIANTWPSRAITGASAFGIFWFVGVLESVAALGKPLGPELLVGVADIIPIIILCLLTSLFISSGRSADREIWPLGQSIAGIIIIAFAYIAGRYFLYAIVGVNSGYLTDSAATFAWTSGMGLAVGIMYVLLHAGIRGKDSGKKGLWFGTVVFGILWMLFNFFMPILFDMSFIDFHPPILNYIWRILVDILSVVIGVWTVEVLSTNKSRIIAG